MKNKIVLMMAALLFFSSMAIVLKLSFHADSDANDNFLMTDYVFCLSNMYHKELDKIKEREINLEEVRISSEKKCFDEELNFRKTIVDAIECEEKKCIKKKKEIKSRVEKQKKLGNLNNCKEECSLVDEGVLMIQEGVFEYFQMNSLE